MTNPYVAGAILIVSFSLFLTFLAGTMRIIEKRRERAKEANRQRFWQQMQASALIDQQEAKSPTLELLTPLIGDAGAGVADRDHILEALQDEHRFIGETGPKKGKVQ